MAAPNSRTMERVYLALAVVGDLVPGSLMLVESVETGDILLYVRERRQRPGGAVAR